MDVLLLIITGASLLTAFLFGLALRRLSREERDRSAARVAALAAAASESVPRESHIVPEALERSPADLPDEWSFPAERASAPQLSSEHAFTAPGSSAGVLPPEMFLTPPEDVQEPRRMQLPEPSATDARQRRLAMGAAALVLPVVGALAWALTSSDRAQPVYTRSAAPLELLTLGHERRGEELAIRGLVRNPANSDPLEQVIATVQLFDAQEAAVATADSAIDVLLLGSGDESSFVIRVQAPRDVVRYRVSFRTELGLVPHVDRRSTALKESLKADPQRADDRKP